MGAGRRVMIVDDNRAFLEELQETLVLCGYETQAVDSSVAAVNAARRGKPDVILLDLRMDGMNGFEVAYRLKQSPETAHIPIIAMSGYFSLTGAPTLLDMTNMVGQIKKPFSVADLVVRIERVLTRVGAEGGRPGEVCPA